MKHIKQKSSSQKWPLFFIIMSFILPISMGHYLYKNNYLFELGDVSHGKILKKRVYVEIKKKRIYKWTIVKIGSEIKNYSEIKDRQVFYNSQLLLNKNKQKINSLYVNLEDITLQKNKINKNIIKENNYLIVDPNSNIIMQYDSSTNLKYIISDVKRLLKYARF